MAKLLKKKRKKITFMPTIPHPTHFKQNYAFAFNMNKFQNHNNILARPMIFYIKKSSV